MSIFDIFGRCNCNGSSSSSSVNNKCICVNTFYQDCDNGADPCGDTFEIDLYNDQENIIYDAPCTNGVTFEITAIDDEFSGVSITDAGVITGTLTGDPDQQYEIYYRMRCPSLGTAVNGRVVMCVTNLCKQVACSDAQFCDPCTGLCENSQADLEVQ